MIQWNVFGQPRPDVKASNPHILTWLSENISTESYRRENLKTNRDNGYQLRTCEAKFDSPLCQLFTPSKNSSLIQYGSFPISL